ncbi:hypothetical protein [Candidatus Thiodiazotropha endoloripes]|uniref:hypothetical protein n=1 Tax=Candidatus Thiodiazotropha endoloripes TaxID=1818881 RepID=UPI0012D7760F|nr:hypothetical protein [Candidatus Thiodiazotropha endoloripes]
MLRKRRRMIHDPMGWHKDYFIILETRGAQFAARQKKSATEVVALNEYTTKGG